MFTVDRLCRIKTNFLYPESKTGYIEQSVAISARSCQSLACRTVYCDRSRTGTKATIMVLIGPSRRQQDAEDVEMKDEDPDWCEPGHQEDDWQFGSYEEIELRLRNDLNVRNLHAVDVVSIGIKNRPIPLKEIRD